VQDTLDKELQETASKYEKELKEKIEDIIQVYDLLIKCVFKVKIMMELFSVEGKTDK
jgi:hypothetical protein